MKQKKVWTKVTTSVWVCDKWAVEDGDWCVELFHDGEWLWSYKSLEQAKRGATQATIDRAAAERVRLGANPPGLARLKEIAR